MKTPIHLNSKGNEVITWCSLSIWSCLFLNKHHCYMCYRRPCSLHHICMSWVSNDDVHQSLNVVFDDKNIQLLSCVVREKVGNLPTNMCSILQNNSYDNISKCIMGCCTLTPVGHWIKWVPRLSMVCSHWHNERWATIGHGKPKWVCSVLRKWDKDGQNASVIRWTNNQAPTLGPHMSKDVLAWYLQERLLEAKQTPIHVGDLTKETITRDKTEPLGS